MLRKSKDETRRVKQIPTDVKIPTIRNEMAVFIFEMYIPKSGIFEMNIWGFILKHSKESIYQDIVIFFWYIMIQLAMIGSNLFSIKY